MRKPRAIYCVSIWLLSCVWLVVVSGCTQTTDASTFLQDFAREALAAFLL